MLPSVSLYKSLHNDVLILLLLCIESFSKHTVLQSKTAVVTAYLLKSSGLGNSSVLSLLGLSSFPPSLLQVCMVGFVQTRLPCPHLQQAPNTFTRCLGHPSAH